MDRYNLVSKIGEGINGTVYRAVNKLTGDIVAIKKVSSNQSGIKQVEVHQLMTNIPYIPRLIEHFLDRDIDLVRGDSIYIVMELIEGTTIYRLLQDNNWSLIWKLLPRVIVTINDLHNRGFYHGDLHLNNIIVNNDKIHLIDFDSSDQCSYPGGVHLPYDWQCYRTYYQLDNRELTIVNIRDDYETIFDYQLIRKLGLTSGDSYFHKYTKMCSRIDELYCEVVDDDGTYHSYNDHTTNLLRLYNRIDSEE